MEKTFKIRVKIFIFIVIAVMLIFVAQLFNLQIIMGEKYLNASQGSLLRNVTLKAPRGNILDRNGKLLATNEEAFRVVIPKANEDSLTLPSSVLNLYYILQRNNELDSKEITSFESFLKYVKDELKAQPYSKFDTAIIANNISRETALEIQENKLEMPDIEIVNDWVRKYVYGDLASHTMSGIEKIFDNYLKGIDGKKHIEIELENENMKIKNHNIDFISGDNVYLTLDLDLQQLAEKSLKENIQEIENASKGAVVVKEIQSGEIYAIASYPTFNPNDFVNGISDEKWKEYNNSETQPLLNRAISGLYPPGSTFKMITAIAGLNEGIITENKKIEDKGIYTEIPNIAPKCLIYTAKNDYRTHGEIDVKDALKVSCNYFFYAVGHKLGINNVSKYAKMFELGNKTGIELPNESTGIVASREFRKQNNRQWYIGEVLSASIGQSDNSFTPIQMANYISIIGNYGIKNRTHIINKIIDDNGNEIDNTEIRKTVEEKNGKYEFNSLNTGGINRKYYDIILEGMRRVTKEDGGTAYYLFGDNNLDVIGKTGTAEVSGYNPDGTKKADNGWFVGIIRGKKKSFAVAVIIEQAGYGSWVANVAKDIAELIDKEY